MAVNTPPPTPSPTSARTPAELLRVADLRVTLPTARGLAQALRGVALHIGAGESVGLIGESGCGKSMTALALIGCCRPVRRPAGDRKSVV